MSFLCTPARRSQPRSRRTPAAAALAALALLLLGTGQPARAAGGFAPAGDLPGLGSGRVWSLAVDPAAPARILAATDDGVYTSADSGNTWQLTLPEVVTWTVGFDLRNPRLALAGTAGQGVYTSTDSGTTWTPSGTGLQNQDVRALAFGLDGIAAGTDAGVALSPDGSVWHNGGLDGYSISALAVAANAPGFSLVAGVDNGNLNAGSLFESTPSGWQALQSGLPAAATVSGLAAGPIDVAQPKHPLVAMTGKGVFRSGDGGVTWSSSVLPASLTPTAVAFDPLDPSVVYIGDDAGGSSGGGFARSLDGGQSFSVPAGPLLPGSRNVEAIAVAPTNPLTVYVAVDPPGGGGQVYVEIDTSVPPAPALLPDAPGAPVPRVVATPTPSPTAPPRAVHHAASPPPSGLQHFAESAFHWPAPLAYEIVVLLVIAYAGVRWRQRHYVEGPP